MAVRSVACSQVTAASSLRTPFSRIFLPIATTCSSCKDGNARFRPATVRCSSADGVGGAPSAS